MPVPSRAIAEWRGTHPVRNLVADVIRAADVEIDYIHEDPSDSRNWGLLLKLPQHLAEIIGTQREILLWGALHTSAEARDVQAAVTFMRRNNVRCAQDVMIFVSQDSSGISVLQEAAESAALTLLALPAASLRQFQPVGRRPLADAVRTGLFARDLYDLRSPVTRGGDFFGRTALLRQLERNITHGQAHVALFGLRKIGKTSFLLRLRDSLRNREAGIIAQADLQRSNAINPTAEYLLWHLGESLWDGNRRVRSTNGLKLFGRFETFSDVTNPSGIFELFDHDLRVVHERVGMPIIILLDEIERMFPNASESQWRADFIRFWQLLRGIDQEHPGTLRFIISGTNPQCVESHAIFGEDNPIYSYFSVTYLGPFSEEEAGDLLNTYGKRMGITWTRNVVSRAFSDTGGHPALLRTFASMVHRVSHPRVENVTPTAEEARDVSARFLTEQGPLLAQIVAILEDQYADEFEILRTLALGRVHEFREMAKAFSEDTAHLIGYGLCGQPDDTTRVSSQLLQTYLQRRENAVSSQARVTSAASIVGSEIDNRYIIESLVSADGGFANVYRAKRVGKPDSAPDMVALKVLKNGRLSVLEREVEVLQRFEHRNIVHFIDSGRLASGDVYLAMEYLDGPTLRSFCEAATRPSEQRLMTWMTALLDALVHMHPKESQLRRLRAESGSEETLQDLLESRYGYVHRDIKPENIIITPRGPVLVDFNISSRVSVPVETVSATPGYLPPELIGPSWSPRVDIHQLGVTMLQAAAGDSLLEGNRDDLVLVMRSTVSPKTSTFIERMIDTSSAGYQTAYTAHRDAQKILDQLGG